MRFGVHLPVVDFGDGSASVRDLQEYVRVARELGTTPWVQTTTSCGTGPGSTG